MRHRPRRGLRGGAQPFVILAGIAVWPGRMHGTNQSNASMRPPVEMSACHAKIVKFWERDHSFTSKIES